MKVFITILFSLLLLAMILSTVTAQDDQLPSLPSTDMMAIDFKPETTLLQAEDLRVKYGLVLHDYPFANENAGAFRYEPSPNLSYDEYVKFYYRDLFDNGEFKTECWKDNSCPPITVWRAYYDPVSAETARQIQQEAIASRVVNNPVFFWIKPAWDWLTDQRVNFSGKKH